jgi:uncharacterized membrane protein (UPF0136 family)
MTPLKMASVAATALGLLSLVGGTIGFVNAGSKASLIAGGISGLLLIASAALMPRKLVVGLVLAEVVSVALLVKFGRAAIQEGTPVSLIMTVVAILVSGLAARAFVASRSPAPGPG